MLPSDYELKEKVSVVCPHKYLLPLIKKKISQVPLVTDSLLDVKSVKNLAGVDLGNKRRAKPFQPTLVR